MLLKELLPFIKLVSGDAEPFTEALQGRNVQEGLCQYAKDKEKAIAGIRDDHVREDRMGMSTALAGQTEDSNFCSDGNPADKVNDPAPIIGMNLAIERGATDRTGLLFRAECIHVGIKQNF